MIDITGKSAKQVLEEYNELRFRLAETIGYIKAVVDIKKLSLVENAMLIRSLKKHQRVAELLERDLATYQLTYPEYLI